MSVLSPIRNPGYATGMREEKIEVEKSVMMGQNK